MAIGVSISVLGPVQLSQDGTPLSSLESTKVRALLIYLAVEAARPHARTALGALLWPEQPATVAQHNLRQALTNLRQALGDRRADPPMFLITRETVQLNPAHTFWLDSAICVELLAACDTHPHRRSTTCSTCTARRARAVALYGGDFLAHFSLPDSDAFEEWASLKREQVRQQVLRALTHLTEGHELRGAYVAAQRTAWRQVELDPWNEEAHQHLMHILWLDGQRSAAIAHYEGFRRTLRQEVGVEPAPETAALAEQIRSTAPVTTGPRGGAAGFPTLATPFIGREAELRRLTDLLQDPACRLITLTGLGGIGKTRLAIQAALTERTTFTEGTYFVALAPLAMADLLVSAIASSLQLVLDTRTPPATQLLRYLRDKDLLLVLDNAEHLLSTESGDAGGVAELVSAILQQVPRVTLLLTSREPLHLQGEWVVHVTGLSFPPDSTSDALESYAAVQLFLAGARRANADFALTEGDAPWLARICRFFAGMPLAIELAAAWVRVLGCRDIAHELEHRLDALVGTLRDLPARHQSLRAVVRHSWDLLTMDEQRVLRRLAVFRGGVDRAAAEQVTGASLHLLTALANKSLLRPGVHPDDHCRFELHEVVRHFAEEQLEAAGEADAVRRRHAEYYLALAEVTEREVRVTEAQVEAALDRLALEHDNFRVALRWSRTAAGGRSLGLRMAAALRIYWGFRGHATEGRTWLDTLLTPVTAEEIQPSLEPATTVVELHARARALHTAGWLAEQQGAIGQAHAHLEESLTLFHQLAPTVDTALAVWSLAHCARQQGHWTRAARLAEESRALYEQVGAPVGIGWAYWLMSEVAREQGDGGGALELATRAVAIARRQQSPVLMGYALFGLARATFTLGDVAHARIHAEEALTIARQVGHVALMAQLLLTQGRLALAEGDEARATAVWEQGLALGRRVQHDRATAEILLEQGRLAHRQGNTVHARGLLEESLQFYQARGHQTFIAECQSILAAIGTAHVPGRSDVIQLSGQGAHHA